MGPQDRLPEACRHFANACSFSRQKSSDAQTHDSCTQPHGSDCLFRSRSLSMLLRFWQAATMIDSNIETGLRLTSV